VHVCIGVIEIEYGLSTVEHRDWSKCSRHNYYLTFGPTVLSTVTVYLPGTLANVIHRLTIPCFDMTW
jgi:hypothetical protein